MLVAGEDGFHSEDDWPVSGQRTLLEERGRVALRAGKRMVIAHEHDICGMKRVLQLPGIKQRIVVTKRLAELAQIFAPAVRILGADFALHSGQRVELPSAATRSQICRG